MGCKSGEIYIKSLGCRPKHKIQQLNNIVIFYTDAHKFGCKTWDRVDKKWMIWEDRLTYTKAKEWAEDTKDWIWLR